LLTSTNGRQYSAIASLSKYLEIPMITWDYPPRDVKSTDFEITLRPALHEAIGDMLILKQWWNVFYVHEADSGKAVLIMFWILLFIAHRKSR